VVNLIFPTQPVDGHIEWLFYLSNIWSSLYAHGFFSLSMDEDIIQKAFSVER
jgi:hypothetical protein